MHPGPSTSTSTSTYMYVQVPVYVHRVPGTCVHNLCTHHNHNSSKFFYTRYLVPSIWYDYTSSGMYVIMTFVPGYLIYLKKRVFFIIICSFTRTRSPTHTSLTLTLTPHTTGYPTLLFLFFGSRFARTGTSCFGIVLFVQLFDHIDISFTS